MKHTSQRSLRRRLLLVVCLAVGTAVFGLAFASSQIVISLFERSLEHGGDPGGETPPDLEPFHRPS